MPVWDETKPSVAAVAVGQSLSSPTLCDPVDCSPPGLSALCI